MIAISSLRWIELFKDFSQSGLETIAEIVVERKLHAGEVLFAEDEMGDSLFVLVRGEVKLLQHSPEGEELEVGVLEVGGLLGTLGVLARTVHLVTAVAASDCELLEISRRDFFTKAQEKPLTCMKLGALVATELSRCIGENKAILRELAARRR